MIIHTAGAGLGGGEVGYAEACHKLYVWSGADTKLNDPMSHGGRSVIEDDGCQWGREQSGSCGFVQKAWFAAERFAWALNDPETFVNHVEPSSTICRVMARLADAIADVFK